MDIAFLSSGVSSVPSYQRTVFGPQGTFRQSGAGLYYSRLASSLTIAFNDTPGAGITRIGGAVAHLNRAFLPGFAVDRLG